MVVYGSEGEREILRPPQQHETPRGLLRAVPLVLSWMWDLQIEPNKAKEVVCARADFCRGLNLELVGESQ